jgi:hypothetical protein
MWGSPDCGDSGWQTEVVELEQGMTQSRPTLGLPSLPPSKSDDVNCSAKFTCCKKFS